MTNVQQAVLALMVVVIAVLVWNAVGIPEDMQVLMAPILTLLILILLAVMEKRDA